MAELGKLSLDDFLDAVAAGTPAPGGGTSAAVVCAIAAGLVEMSATLADTADAAEHAVEMRGRALRLAEKELSSYAPVLEARTEADRVTALDGASEPPAQIAELAAELAELGLSVAESASEAVRGDALTGVTLAEAAASAAARLVAINVGSGPAFERAQAAAGRAADAREKTH